MDKIQKLLRKISKRDREKLLELVERLLGGDKQGLNIKKVINSEFYRLRSGRFRIIFHKEDKNIIIDSIRLRNEKTYK